MGKQLLKLGNTHSTTPLVLPTTTTLCAAPPSAAGFQGGSEQRGHSHTKVNSTLCDQKTGIPTIGNQGGRSSPIDARHVTPEDGMIVNIAAAEAPLRRLVSTNTDWAMGELPKTPVFPAKPDTSSLMDHLDLCLSLFKITLPLVIAPVVKNGILMSDPDSDDTLPTEEWAARELDDAFIPISKTG